MALLEGEGENQALVAAEGAPWDGAKGDLKSHCRGRGDLQDKKTVGEYAG